MDEQTNLVPEWMEGKKINESLFCREYLQEHPMIAISGTFFTVDGRVTDEAKLMRNILEKIEPYVTSGFPERCRIFWRFCGSCATQSLCLWKQTVCKQEIIAKISFFLGLLTPN